MLEIIYLFYFFVVVEVRVEKVIVFFIELFLVKVWEKTHMSFRKVFLKSIDKFSMSFLFRECLFPCFFLFFFQKIQDSLFIALLVSFLPSLPRPPTTQKTTTPPTPSSLQKKK